MSAALRPHGKLCFVGVPPGVLGLPVFPLVTGQKVVTGSPGGSPRMIREMLRVAERHKVQAITERFAMSKANDAMTKVKKNQVRYRAVLANLDISKKRARRFRNPQALPAPGRAGHQKMSSPAREGCWLSRKTVSDIGRASPWDSVAAPFSI